jgi:serine kinase of HPr protein (carbohydrate metabolism regulator)
LSSTVHASAVLVGARAILIQGPSGSGKSRLALNLLQAADRGALRFARLIGDDRVQLEAVQGRLLVRPASTLAGLLEVRGSGIRHMPYEPVGVVGSVVDLGVPSADRLPAPADQRAEIYGIALPRLAVAAGMDAFPMLLATLQGGNAQS